ncbi:quinol monooxygenase YgiN [Roseibium hamelinense]|uniref:Quinol monooxygenase YgiN n=1 Tax=Roseibium hamelinense TaxID=150831 RepID=A0A562TGT4_9HYPH|nr:putative quinol monooxygenase [Roseibium hamelinense]MTI43120.1 antibiotic biosynthesis monooxygenase [Roseibium hamelinense]TWI92533.1 quinol monooxygenase YgiN [Roseibium hamelinense]
MSNLTIIANIHAKPNQIDLVKSELLKLIPTTVKERGCLTYELHQNTADPAHFTFTEIWETRELWRDHMNAPHLAAYMTATEGAIAEFSLTEMTKIG